MKGGGVSWHGITPNQDGHEDTHELQIGLLDDRYGEHDPLPEEHHQLEHDAPQHAQANGHAQPVLGGPQHALHPRERPSELKKSDSSRLINLLRFSIHLNADIKT